MKHDCSLSENLLRYYTKFPAFVNSTYRDGGWIH